MCGDSASRAAGIHTMTLCRGYQFTSWEVCSMQGTTTNGRYLLPFRTGAFLAGVPVQPVIIKYGQARVAAGRPLIPAHLAGRLHAASPSVEPVIA